ncbi:RAM signaling network component, partial [Ascosphaera acerosa]
AERGVHEHEREREREIGGAGIAGGGGGPPSSIDDLRPKLTINMGRSHVGRVPDAVVELLKPDVARLSLSHNAIARVPARIAECVHLRYLNIRANKFAAFPAEVLALPYLEILDLSRNRIAELPPRVRDLASLRVLSLMQNHIADLPDEVGDMAQLHILKLTGNPLKPPLKRIVERHGSAVQGERDAPPPGGRAPADKDKDPSLTMEIKRFLKKRRAGLPAPPSPPLPLPPPSQSQVKSAKRIESRRRRKDDDDDALAERGECDATTGARDAAHSMGRGMQEGYMTAPPTISVGVQVAGLSSSTCSGRDGQMVRTAME